jgi:hypothetical protein
MSKYNPLADRLAAHTGDEWGASFSELEAVLGFPLPKAAQSGRAWWTNDPDKSHSRAWAAQGWEVGDVDHSARRVVFRRGAVSAAALMRGASLEPLPRAEPAVAAAPIPATAPGPAAEIQPAALREASETASSKMHRNRALGAGALVAAGAAVVTAVGAILLRGRGRPQ